MLNIENTYVSYEELLDFFGREKVSGRIEQIYSEIEGFLATYDLHEFAHVHRMSLDHAVMDYFSDI